MSELGKREREGGRGNIHRSVGLYPERVFFFCRLVGHAVFSVRYLSFRFPRDNALVDPSPFVRETLRFFQIREGS